MSKGRRIVYSSSGSSGVGSRPESRSAPQPTTNHQQQLQRASNAPPPAAPGRQHHGNAFHRPLSLQNRSPRKRKISPPPNEPSKLPKVVPLQDQGGNNFDDDGDELDQLGVEAVVQYELTQRERSMSPKDPILPPPPPPQQQPPPPPQYHPPIPTSRHIQTGRTSPVNVLDSSFPARTKSSTQPNPLPSFGPANQPLPPPPPPPPRAAQAAGSFGDSAGLEERIKFLQEQNYSKDGEVKVLRGEKERLLGELRRKEESMKQMRAQLLSEKREREKELMREKVALESKLQFKEQETVSLQEKLEKLSHGIKRSSTSPGGIMPGKGSRRASFSTPDSAVSARGKGKPANSSNSGNKPVEFLSTENFLPLSQLSSDSGVMSVSPVMGMASHRHHSKDPVPPTSTTRTSASQGKEKTRSRSISPSPSDLKKMKKRSISDRGDSSTSRKKSRSLSETGSSSCGGEEFAVETGACPLSVAIPGRELADGAQLLMLLTNLNLLRPPFCLRQAAATTTTTTTTTAAATLELSLHDSSSSSCSSGSTCSLEQQQTKLEDCSTDRIPGLLSLLPPHGGGMGMGVASPSSSTSSSFPKFSTPMKDVVLRSTSSDSDSLPTTPTWHAPSHPPVLKLHTVARSNIAHARIRRNSGLLTANRKAFSTANTPVRAPPTSSTTSGSTSSSLLSSINAGSLQRNINNLLASTEVARFSSFASSSSSRQDPRAGAGTKGSLFSFSASSSSHLLKNFSPGENSNSDVMEILKEVGQLITRYHQEHESRSKVAGSSDSGSESTEGSFTLSPKTSSSVSRSGGCDIVPPPSLGDQQLVVQALEILEVLVAYSRKVREQILLQPPVFAIDSRPSSSLDVHHNPPSLNTSLEGVEPGGATPSNLLVEASHRLDSLQRREERELSQSCEPGEEIMKWKNHELSQLKRPLSSKVWVDSRAHSSQPAGEQATSGETHPLQVIPGGRSGCGHLFSVLLELPVSPWKQGREIALSCFKTLTSLAKDCPVESLHRFGLLLQKETILICLEREDPPLTLSILTLLPFLVSSEDLVGMLCTRATPAEPCLLLTCYQALLDPPASARKEMAYRIQLQVVEFVSRLAVSAGGQVALYEKCTCSHELLSALVSLLERMVEGVYHVSQWSKQEVCLVHQVISLVFRISVSDRYFDSHRDRCEHAYTLAFSRLAVLMKQQGHQDHGDDGVVMSLVNELLSYCEDLEDSHEH